MGEIFEVSEEEKQKLEADVRKGVKELEAIAKEDDYFRLTFFWENKLEFTLLLGGQGRPADPILGKTVIKLPRGEYIPEQVKVGNYVNELYLKKSVAREGFNDVLYVYNDTVLEFSTGNIFFGEGDKLITPYKRGIFSGIIRNKIVEHAKELGITVEERNIDIREIPGFDFAFLSNSVKLLLPVEKIDDRKYERREELRKTIIEGLKKVSQGES